MSAPALLLIGSHRENGNAAGLAAWVTSVWDARCAARSGAQPALQSARDTTTALPAEGALTDDIIPQMITASDAYPNPAVRAWSARVRASSACVVLSPQYNWGYPGALKNSIDHLFWEWQAKPILVITYGGHGGDKAAAALRLVFDGGVKAKVVGQVLVTLPSDFIRKAERVSPGSPAEFLKAYKAELASGIDAVLDAISAQGAASAVQ
jgi:NAD(P)H-dependent FMN reductase